MQTCEKQTAVNRKSVITRTSILGIAVNLLIAGLKIAIGTIASSVAIISEGVNNASDALNGLLTLVGNRLSGMHPDKKHPFGYGRIEYLTSLVISIIILYSGIEMLISAVEHIIHPVPLELNYLMLIIVGASGVVKFFLGIYTIRQGRRASSVALEAVGMECRNDCFLSLVTIASSLIFLIFDFSIDAYAGIFTSLLILKAGLDALRQTVSELLGRPGQAELAADLYREIRSTPGIVSAVDMMLHNYGPENYSGSVNVEMAHDKTVGELYEILHALQLRIMREYHVVMVFGVYAVDHENEKLRPIRSEIAAFVHDKPHVLSYHALYLDEKNHRLYCDLLVDYALRDWDGLREQFISHMEQFCPGYEIILTVETEFV